MTKNKRGRLKAIVIILTVAQVLGVLSSIHSVMTTRTAQGTIGWVIALNTIPVAAVPAYWAFGRNRMSGYVSSRREGREAITPVTEELLKASERFRVPDAQKIKAVEAAERLAALPTLAGNHSTLLIDGQETFDSIFEGIEAADDYLLLMFFIVRNDELGKKLQQRLIDKAAEGVDVYFMYDAIGSLDLPPTYAAELRDAGVNVQAFRSGKGLLHRFQINFRNHRKIVVADGEVAWIGGHNVGDEYLGKDPELSPWRDSHIRVEGPAALGAQLAFVEDWHWATDEVPELNWIPEASPRGDEKVLMVGSGPADELETAALMFIHAINTAEERVWIASPYYVPDQAVIGALQLAGLRGVDVRILIPDQADGWLVDLAAYSYFFEGGKTGVKFFRYEDGFMHRKAILIDHDAAAIGSANFDNRSFRLNFEITGLFMAPSTIRQVEEMFLADFEKSRRVEPEVLDRKPFWFRFAVRAARLAAPIL
ncbi:MAG: cardiolipin synthase [Xanthomonadales bacterium]|nr:cardiolipin synthase [Xanthomonadales bacterium]